MSQNITTYLSVDELKELVRAYKIPVAGRRVKQELINAIYQYDSTLIKKEEAKSMEMKQKAVEAKQEEERKREARNKPDFQEIDFDLFSPDVVYEIIKNLEYLDILKLCQSSQKYRKLCKEKRLQEIIEDKRKHVTKLIEYRYPREAKRININIIDWSKLRIGTMILKYSINDVVTKYPGIIAFITSFDKMNPYEKVKAINSKGFNIDYNFYIITGFNGKNLYIKKLDRSRNCVYPCVYLDPNEPEQTLIFYPFNDNENGYVSEDGNIAFIV